MSAPRKTGYPCARCTQEYLCPPEVTPMDCGALRSQGFESFDEENGAASSRSEVVGEDTGSARLSGLIVADPQKGGLAVIL